jgi:Cof subfamily protein (haloacid dehalogenase superfamily)
LPAPAFADKKAVPDDPHRNAPMKPRLIALDLDGTTIDKAGLVHPRTRAAIAAARASGVEVMLVTGRHHVTTKPYQVELGLAGPAICCNGTYVYDFAADRVDVGTPMTRDEARRLLALARRHGVHALVYTTAAMTYEVENAHMRALTAWGRALPEAVRPNIVQIADFDAEIDAAPEVWKFVISHDDPAVLTAWHDEAGRDPGFSLEYSWFDRIDAARAGNTKGGRLVAWAAARGIAASEIVAFGDNHNDLSMLTAVGRGIAMGNAEDAVKAAVAEVIGPHGTEALGEAIERLIA